MPVPDRAPTVSTMAMQEIYIRNATEIEARGPFSAQQIADLAEAGQVTAETLRKIARRPAAFPRVLATSAEKGTSIPELRAEILAACDL